MEESLNRVKEALKILIAGESSAVKMYTQYSQKADEEGFKNISLLFRALVMAEKIHIKNHLNALNEDFRPEVEEDIEIGSTLENLSNALIGEMEENKNLYPRLVKSIKKDCHEEYGKVARLSMTWAQKVEKEHAVLLKKALKNLKKGRDLDFDNIYICQVCGNVVVDNKSEKECEICGHDIIFFKNVKGDK